MKSLNRQNESFSSNVELSDNSLGVKYKPVYNIHQGSILKFLIKKNRRKDSCKTTNTNISKQPIIYYNLKEIKKFDELNNSFSDISDFELEKQIDENKSEFNSSEDDNYEYEDEEIFNKCRIKFKEKKYDDDFENEVENNFKEIIKILNNKI